MQNRVGELRGRTPHKEIIRTSTIQVIYDFGIDLLHNDVPVTLHYKHGNNPWKSLIINKAFTVEAIPHNSDVYLSASLSNAEHVIYSITY